MIALKIITKIQKQIRIGNRRMKEDNTKKVGVSLRGRY